MSEVNEELEVMSMEMIDESMKTFQPNELVEAEVVAVGESDITVTIVGNKNDVPIPLKELANNPVPAKASDVVKVGDVIEVAIVSVGGEHGLTVSKVRAAQQAAWKELENLEMNEPIEAVIQQVVKGGLVAIAKGVRAFIPASQIELHYVKDLNAYVGQTVKALPLDDVDAVKHRLVLSRRRLLEIEREQKQAEIFDNVQAGQRVTGTVKRLVDYGAFIDIGGVDGLAHISDLSWNRVSKPSDVLQEGQEVEVLVKSIDPESKRISLSIKDTQPDPWQEKAAKYEVGNIISGKIIKLTKFGAFMEIEPGFDGLIPMGELAKERIEKAEDAVQQGEEVKVKIIRIDVERKRISLSITKAKDAE